MLTLYHSRQSRSSILLALLQEMGVVDQVEIRHVEIPRQDGSGKRDPQNPHPEGKVPFLVNGTDTVRERGAIMLYLTDHFAGTGLGPLPGEAGRGQYLSWLFWYQGVFEPVAILRYIDVSHPVIEATFRDYGTALAQIEAALETGPYLLGDEISAADFLIASPFLFFGEGMPRSSRVDDWVKRIATRPSMVWAKAYDA